MLTVNNFEFSICVHVRIVQEEGKRTKRLDLNKTKFRCATYED